MSTPLPSLALIRSLEERNERAVELAERLSFAVRVEPFLLRRMRLELLPEFDAGTEADFWLSPLVQVRSPEGVLLFPEIAAELRRRLYRRSHRKYVQSWRLVRRLHSHLPVALRMEERIAFLSGITDPNSCATYPHALQKIDRLLHRAAKTLVSSKERGGITHWAASALSRMPQQTRDLEGARMLALASYLRLTQNLPVTELPQDQPMPSWMAWVLPTGLPNTKVKVRLLKEGIELTLGKNGTHEIKVPDIKPCLVEISWKSEDGKAEVEQVLLQHGEPRLVTAKSSEFDIRTVQGKRYRLAEKKTMAERNMPTCYVVMGFGKKTDYQTSRVLDLDASYTNIIKPAIEKAGYECLRADEISHAGNINVPHFEWLLKADVLIADVSTYNANAFYELGVRHALRPYATIVIAEDKLVFPFDINQVAVRKYHHLGEDIGASEAVRMQAVLAEAIAKSITHPEVDSPVYTFISGLNPPTRTVGTEERAQSPRSSRPRIPQAETAPESGGAQQATDQPTVRALMDQVEAAFKNSDFATAKSLLEVVRSMMPNDPYVLQRLVLATYRSNLPTSVDALKEALELLKSLAPETSTDTETLGLYGAVQKRLWEQTHDPKAMDDAVWALEKGFYLKNDYYNGINLAYMLNLRADVNVDQSTIEAVADFVQAQRVRRKVLTFCEAALRATPPPTGETEFWIKAAMTEAYTGLGEKEQAGRLLESARRDVKSGPVPSWIMDTTEEQLAKLRSLLDRSPLDRITIKGPASVDIPRG